MRKTWDLTTNPEFLDAEVAAFGEDPEARVWTLRCECCFAALLRRHVLTNQPGRRTRPLKCASPTTALPSWGAVVSPRNRDVDRLLSLCFTVADRTGHMREVVHSPQSVEGLRADESRWYGATIGRYANRIGEHTWLPSRVLCVLHVGSSLFPSSWRHV